MKWCCTDEVLFIKPKSLPKNITATWHLEMAVVPWAVKTSLNFTAAEQLIRQFSYS